MLYILEWIMGYFLPTLIQALSFIFKYNAACRCECLAVSYINPYQCRISEMENPPSIFGSIQYIHYH